MLKEKFNTKHRILNDVRKGGCDFKNIKRSLAEERPERYIGLFLINRDFIFSAANRI